jgi:hypothetical protein
MITQTATEDFDDTPIQEVVLVMDPDSLADFLKQATARAVTVTAAEGLPPELSMPLAQLMTKVELVLFRSYRTADGTKDNIRGEIEPDTLEFKRGFRFFGANGILYRSDGTIAENIVSPLDLCEPCEIDDVTGSPDTDQTWIHPQQRLQTSFFNLLTPSTMRVEVGWTYLNRMGFVVEIMESSVDTDTGLPVYRDQYGTTYDKRGQVFTDTPSMVDLAYKISHLRYLSGAGSSLRKQLAKDEQEYSPECHDPIEHDRGELEQAWVLKLLALDREAKELGIPFGFHLFKM